MFAEDDVSRLLAAQHRASLEHLLQDEPVPHLGGEDLDPRLLHGLVEPDVRHDRRHDGVAGQLASPLQGQGARRQHEVAVDGFATRSGEQRAIGVAVERHAGRGPLFQHGLGHDLRVHRAAPHVDVRAVGPVGDRGHLGPQPPQRLGPGHGRGAVRGVHHDPQPRQVVPRGPHQMGHVAFGGVLEHGDRAAGLGGRAVLANVRLDLRFQLVGELEPPGAEQLDPVVLGRVVRRRDHDARRGPQLHREERNGGRGLHTHEQRVAAPRPNPVGQRLLQHRPGRPRVAPDQDAGPALAVSPECPRGRGAHPPGQGGVELVPGHAPDSIGAEELVHGATAYPLRPARSGLVFANRSGQNGRVDRRYSGSLVLVYTTPSITDGYLARGRLEAEGIPVMAKGEGEGPYRMGPVLLYVPEELEVQAVFLLDEMRSGRLEIIEDEDLLEETDWLEAESEPAPEWFEL